MLLTKIGRSATSFAGPSFSAFYSTVTGLAALRNWRVSGPAPVSLVGDAPTPVEKEKRPKARASYNNGEKPPSLRPTSFQHKRHKEKLKERFPEGWSPPKKLSRPAMDGIRLMHAQHPEVFTTPVLAQQFKVSPEAIRRILKSKWEPTKVERARMLQREERQRQEYIQQRRAEEIKSQMEMQKERERIRRQREDSQFSLR